MNGIMKAIKLFVPAALVLSAAAVGACNTELQPAQVQNNVTLVASISLRDCSSRALTDPGDGTLASSWTVGEAVRVSYQNTSSQTVEAKATVTAVALDGSATITATLSDPVSCTAGFGYPYSSCTSMQPVDIFTDQLGTLADVSANYDIVLGSGALVVDGSEATLPTGVDMERQTCVWKLSFTDGNTDITSDITGLVINDGSNAYSVTPVSCSDIYVSMYPTVTGATVTMTATTASGTYSASKSGVTLAAGKMYTSAGVALALSTNPIAQAEALKENTYSIQKTGEAAQVFKFPPEYSQWYVGPSWMDGSQMALHVELMDEDPEQYTMGWFTGEFPEAIAGELTTVDDNFFSEFSWASAKVGTMRLGQGKMLDVHMAKGGNVKLDGRSQFIIKPKIGTKSYSGKYQILFVFVFDNWTWDQETESYISGDEYIMCGNAILDELIADLNYFSLEGGYGAWLAPGQSLKITAQWTAGATFDWSKVTLNSQTSNGYSGEWFSWDASTQTLYCSQSADNQSVSLTFGYAGTDLTYNMSVYSGPGYSSFSLTNQYGSSDFILAENDPADGWSSDTVWLRGDEWAPDSYYFNAHSIEIDPGTENYDKLSYNDYGPYVSFKKGISEGDFNLVFRSKADHSVKCTIPVKVVHHKATSFKITYPHSNGLFEPWSSGGENGKCNYPVGMELGVITVPEDAYWNWSHVELASNEENFNYYGHGGKEEHAMLVPKTSHDSPVLGTQVIFSLKWDNRKKSEIYVDQN